MKPRKLIRANHLRRSSPLKEAYHQHNNRDDEQDMDEPAHRITAQEPQQPEYHEYHKNRPDHLFPLTGKKVRYTVA